MSEKATTTKKQALPTNRFATRSNRLEATSQKLNSQQTPLKAKHGNFEQLLDEAKLDEAKVSLENEIISSISVPNRTSLFGSNTELLSRFYRDEKTLQEYDAQFRKMIRLALRANTESEWISGLRYHEQKQAEAQQQELANQLVEEQLNLLKVGEPVYSGNELPMDVLANRSTVTKFIARELTTGANALASKVCKVFERGVKGGVFGVVQPYGVSLELGETPHTCEYSFIEQSFEVTKSSDESFQVSRHERTTIHGITDVRVRPVRSPGVPIPPKFRRVVADIPKFLNRSSITCLSGNLVSGTVITNDKESTEFKIQPKREVVRRDPAIVFANHIVLVGWES